MEIAVGTKEKDFVIRERGNEEMKKKYSIIDFCNGLLAQSRKHKNQM